MSLSTLRKMTDEMDALSVEPAMIRDGRIAWPGGPAMAQNFSLPASIMYYIAMNLENPEVYNKLIQCCKYFFERNPILVAAVVTEKAICSNDECSGNGKCCVKMDINKIRSKIWLTRRLRLDQNNVPNFVALLRPKVYRCDIAHFYVVAGTIEFEDFKFFALSATEFRLDTQIVCNDTPVMLENVLETLPNVEEYLCWFEDNASMVSASTLKNISKLKNLGNLNKFHLNDIPEVFQLDDLFTFIKDHNDMKIALRFAENISEHYKIQLDQFIDSLIDSHLSNGYISYPGQNQDKKDILRKRFFN